MHEMATKVEATPRLAAIEIRDAFRAAKYDWHAAARALACHHQTLRKWARKLKITASLAKERERAWKKGEISNETGRPKKAMASSERIIREYIRNGFTMEGAATALDVSVPTLRSWVKALELDQALKDSKKKA